MRLKMEMLCTLGLMSKEIKKGVCAKLAQTPLKTKV
jgi:hypothetical protein